MSSPSTSSSVDNLAQDLSDLTVLPGRSQVPAIDEINKFSTDSRELIKALIQNTHLSKQPGAEKLVDQARDILADVIAQYSSLCDLTRASATQMRKLRNVDIPVTDDQATAYDITLELKTQFLHITQSLRKAGGKEFDDISDKVSEFNYENVLPIMEQLQRGDAKDEARKISLTDSQDFVGGVDPPQAGGTHLGVLIAFIAGPFVKYGVRKGTQALQRKILAIKDRMEVRQAEMNVISSIDTKSVEATGLAGDCGQQWHNVHVAVWDAADVEFIKEAFPAQKITPEMKQRTEQILGTLFDAFHQLEREMADVKNEQTEDRSMSAEVEEFTNGIQHLSRLVRQLFSLSDVVQESHSKIVREHARKLAQLFQAQLQLLLEVIVEWMVYIRQSSSRGSLSSSFITQLARLSDANKTFSTNTQSIRQELITIHSAKFSAWKSSKAKKKREQDRKIPQLVEDGLPLATTEHVSEALDRLKRAIETVWTFSLDVDLGLVYWSSQEHGENSVSPSVDEAVPQGTLRKNPFLVDESLLRRTRETVKREAKHLSKLAVDQQRALTAT
ncbi:hypothetical protein D9756_009544 [Leucocoprinus leucothites]|uniref:Uncharacterized protein n=1 Tax=Leucocoprinus leucothites TaxID=201217 RepID=A0A8H5FTV5_9AGAR|nr:hypothetical protein D9756_009544 [Leucoagaricus leucothites]